MHNVGTPISHSRRTCLLALLQWGAIRLIGIHGFACLTPAPSMSCLLLFPPIYLQETLSSFYKNHVTSKISIVQKTIASPIKKPCVSFAVSIFVGVRNRGGQFPIEHNFLLLSKAIWVHPVLLFQHLVLHWASFCTFWSVFHKHGVFVSQTMLPVFNQGLSKSKNNRVDFHSSGKETNDKNMVKYFVDTSCLQMLEEKAIVSLCR